MHKPLIAALLLLGATAAAPGAARADEFSTDAVPILKNVNTQREAAAAARQGLRV